MKAMILRRTVSLDEIDNPLELVELPIPEPRADEVLIRISACGVCHTELDEIEGRTAPPRFPVVLGHEVVGRVVELGARVAAPGIGERVGVGWIYSSSGDADENLSSDFVATGRDTNGGYAEYMTVPSKYVYPIPSVFTDVQAAPMLCAGGIGYRALKLSGIVDGNLLGLMGFGASAHLVLQLARHLYPHSKLYVFARDKLARQLATQLGADWVGDSSQRSPQLLHAIIDTTPAWKPIIQALGNLRPGGRLVINAIRKEEDDKDQLLELNYQEHLWMEKEIKSVANIASADLAEFLPLAASIPLEPQTETYALQDANRALMELKRGGARGAKVLVME